MEFRDLKKQYTVLKDKIDTALIETVTNGTYIMGKPVTDLEKELAEYVGVKHCISCANGTDALSLILMAWNIGEGDAVFVPTFTFFASAEVVAFEGATPIFVDVEEETFNIDCISLEKEIIRIKESGKLIPKVIITVDLFGLPANYPEIQEIADKYNLKILEDGAQGFGGNIKGKRACSFGDAATTSFFPAKPLGCYGDGGAIFTNDDDLAKKIISLRVHGKGNSKYDNVRIGVNSRLDTIQAAILKPKFDAFKDYELENVNTAYLLYNKELQGIVKTPMVPQGYYSSFAQYTIFLNNEHIRDGLQSYLKSKEIPSMVYYRTPMHLQTAFRYLEYKVGDFPIAEKLSKQVLSLPMHPYLEKEDIVSVCTAIKDYFVMYGTVEL